jgi:hypothetical protein
MRQEQIESRLERLLLLGGDIPVTSNERWADGSEHVSTPRYLQWRSQTLVFLKSILPPMHDYVREFAEATALDQRDYASHAMREAGLGILAAVEDDLKAGFLPSADALISAEIFTDFLAMAAHLVQQSYHHAAASITGAVLEDSLKRALGERGVKPGANLESCNQRALDADMYGPVVFTQVKVWIGVRNDADHGKWDQVVPAQVEAMVRDVPTFLRNELGLP